MSPFVVRSCEGDIVRSDGFVRRSFMRSLLLLLFLLLLLLLLLSPLTSTELILCGCCSSMIFFSCRSQTKHPRNLFKLKQRWQCKPRYLYFLSYLSPEKGNLGKYLQVEKITVILQRVYLSTQLFDNLVLLSMSFRFFLVLASRRTGR